MHEQMPAPHSGKTRLRVLREAVIADDGIVLTGTLDHGLVPHDAAATDVKRTAAGPGRSALRPRSRVCPAQGGAMFAELARAAL